MRRHRTVVACAVCLVAVAPAYARERDVRYGLTDAGNAAAAPAVLRLSDLAGQGLGSDWDGGKAEPDRPTDAGCPNIAMPATQGTVTGLAKSDFGNAGFELTTEAQVFATAAMAARFERDEAAGPRGLACVRDSVAHATPPVRVLSSVRIPATGLGPRADAYRIVITDEPNPGHPQVIYVADAVRGRTQVGIIAVGRASTARVLGKATIALMRTLVARARA